MTIDQALAETYQANRALLSGLRETDLARPTTNPTWRVRQLAAHIAEDDGGSLYVGRLLARGRNAKAPEIMVNLANWWTLRKYKRARPADLVAVLDRKHQELMSWLATLPAEQLAQAGEVSGMGRLTLGEFLVRTGAHSREHAADLRAAIEQ